MVEALALETGLPAERVALLFDRYGTRARAVAAFCAKAPDAELPDAPRYSRREIHWLVANEMAACLEAAFFRRSVLALAG